MRCSRTEAPSLRRRYPASPVLRASPPPCAARPDPRGLSVGVCYATGRASRVASIPLLHTCRRHYPGGTGRCSRRSLPDRWQPSPYSGRVGFRITRFEACAAFTRVAARVVAEPPWAALCRRSASADYAELSIVGFMPSPELCRVVPAGCASSACETRRLRQLIGLRDSA